MFTFHVTIYVLISPTGGLEKILRLLQSIAQIIAFRSSNPHDIIIWMHIRKQFALGEESPSLSFTTNSLPLFKLVKQKERKKERKNKG